ncbi:hypothetical protein [Tenacibaculum soleae]|uniref:hypothetical protein n=1 Tax=Tenacibaculum soleae TaxID=447689 RepID=UPI0023007F89|nr:hypothetical protein [Tenacibaculum soleae]
MYRGFNIKTNLSDQSGRLEKIGLSLNNDFQKKIKEKLNEFTLNKGVLSATSIMDEWFPQIKADLFLSHSHKDEKTALILAGWLYEKLNIKTFIDSTIWGYSNDLLDIINNEYCYNSERKTYDYRKSNNSSTHVNLMLSNALNRMIDSCECIFFLNTPNSISSKDTIDKTFSPWIFSEISTTQIIKKKTPNRLKLKTVMFSAESQLNEHKRSELQMEYDLELSHLTNLNSDDIRNWVNTNGRIPMHALDTLYSQHPINKKFII